MITRTFLFLLAMVTGFSAANAAETARVTPSEIGAAASVVLVHGIAAQTAEQANAVASFLPAQPSKLSAMAKLSVFCLAHQTSSSSRTYRGDRARE
jgi:hypothetical protein